MTGLASGLIEDDEDDGGDDDGTRVADDEAATLAGGGPLPEHPIPDNPRRNTSTESRFIVASTADTGP
jgi:hypothetical protein